MPTYEEITLGREASLTTTVTEEMVRTFADLSGDHNPVHLDESYAQTSFFKKRVVHGALLVGFISAVLGSQLPGPGAIYLSQTLEFKRPVYLGETVTAEVKAVEKLDRQKKIKFQTTMFNQSRQPVLEGWAWVLVR